MTYLPLRIPEIAWNWSRGYSPRLRTSFVWSQLAREVSQ